MVKTASIAPHVARDDSSLATRLDNSLDTLWVSLQPVDGRPLNFSPELLAGLERLLDRIEGTNWHWQEDSREYRLHYLVLTSNHPRHFALGGDLAYFQSCIEGGNAGALRAYSMRCLELVRRIYAAAHEVTTVALVQGRALGGGFETALSATHLIAERGAQFGFPEIAFGTFPCTGGMTLLANRIGLRRAAAFMRNARIHSATDLHTQGVVDELCEPGEGPAAVQRFIAEHRRRYNARMALQRAETRMGSFDLAEMRTVVEDWVATAMALSAEERRVLDTLVRMQAADAGAAPVTPPIFLKRSA
ncbi:MAG: enoyl-CoA hydratase/isomerase family protein [Sulfuritalea sp.]|jgi:DSF synthase|nr:enoyl-CoA hydratase/isomerase family protein [Sulfuritalea sp.]